MDYNSEEYQAYLKEERERRRGKLVARVLPEEWRSVPHPTSTPSPAPEVIEDPVIPVTPRRVVRDSGASG